MASNDPLRHLVIGYPKLAGQMEIQPETAIFRRFGALNARNLLYLQAEIMTLEKQLCEREVMDNCDEKGMKSQYALDWFWLSQSADDGDIEQLRLILKIRELLKEYNQTLIQQSTILNLPEPDKWDLEDIQNFLNTTKMGSLALVGDDAVIWGSVTARKSHCCDLVGLRPRPKEDAFSGWVAENAIVNLFRCGCARFKAPSRIHGKIGYEDATILKITYWMTSILASVIPIASIVVLYYVQSMPARFAIITAFNILVSVCLSGFTNAKRSEVFAVTAAFAAVQVVFVGTDKNVPSGG